MAPLRATLDYYDYMGIAQDADDNQIKAAYRQLAKLYHPDRNRGNDEAKAKFQTLQEAYSILIDIEKRRQYNQIYPSIRTKYATPKASANDRGTAQWDSTTTKPAQDNDASLRVFQEQLSTIDRELQALYQSLNRTKGTLKESQGSLDEVLAALQKLDLEDREDEAAEVLSNGWYSYLFGGQKSSAQEEERKNNRARRQTERRVGRLVHESKRSRCRDNVKGLQGTLAELEIKVELKEAQRKFVLRKREDAKRAAEWARVYAEQQAARQKKQEEAQRAQEEEKKAQEWSRKHQEESRRFEEEIRKSQEDAWKARADEFRKRRERDEKARKEKDENDRREREERVRKENAEKARKERIEKARKESEERARREREERLRKERIEKAQKESQGKARREREETDRREAAILNSDQWLKKTREAKKAQEAEAARRWETDVLKETRKTNGKGKTPHRAAACSHKTWWIKVDGGHLCKHCEELTFRFAYKCPDCLTMACAGCMRSLKA
ncbi:chaperone protein [Grosmannia clavigera kw1407]|uniref:Chaperone protein n=1 Tax=Grosmannia clavigera (strain kw1407 / UAMH 11150) TaxID=655863 RepID=F0XA12_GROCL|nr:chaperone protein [Grosmannia clavigera kw1407]EFX05419.1 chaperone protein [Grosmannia clavigera kw1407]